ncbi:MAG: hypothetical protein Q7S84_02010 [bacterium]|nr:hypothetical protein [bacterium]
MEPQIISESRVPNEDTNVWKIGAVAILFAASGLLVVTRAQALMSAPSAGRAWLALAALVCFGVIGTLVPFLVKNRSVLAMAALVACLLPVVGFASRFTGAEFPTVLVIGFIVYATLVLRAFVRAAGAVKNSVRVRFFAIARTVLPRLATAALLFASLLVYLNYTVWGGFTPELRGTLVRATASTADPVLQLWFPGVSFEMTGTEFFRATAAAELKHLYPKTITGEVSGQLTDGFLALPPPAQEQLIAEAAVQIQKSFERFAGPLDERLPMRDALATALERYVATLPTSAMWLLGVICALLIFGTLKSFASLTYWVVEGIAFLIFKFLLLTGFAKMNVEMRSHEFVSVP